jgi:hypothetical protein
MRDELNFRAAAISDEKAYEILLDYWVIPTLALHNLYLLENANASNGDFVRKKLPKILKANLDNATIKASSDKLKEMAQQLGLYVNRIIQEWREATGVTESIYVPPEIGPANARRLRAHLASLMRAADPGSSPPPHLAVARASQTNLVSGADLQAIRDSILRLKNLLKTDRPTASCTQELKAVADLMKQVSEALHGGGRIPGIGIHTALDRAMKSFLEVTTKNNCVHTADLSFAIDVMLRAVRAVSDEVITQSAPTS